MNPFHPTFFFIPLFFSFLCAVFEIQGALKHSSFSRFNRYIFILGFQRIVDDCGCVVNETAFWVSEGIY
jgi:hypothetical protein